MRLLLDAHVVLWWESNDPRLSDGVRELVGVTSEAVFFSRGTLWEIALNISIGRLRVHIARFARNVEQHGFQWLDIKNHHLLTVAALPTFDDHKDPFDRLLVAQSLTEPLVLPTTDANLARYGPTVRVI